MITWKVRGRSSSQTPDPVSTPMPSARISSINPLPSGLGLRRRWMCTDSPRVAR